MRDRPGGVAGGGAKDLRGVELRFPPSSRISFPMEQSLEVRVVVGACHFGQVLEDWTSLDMSGQIKRCGRVVDRGGQKDHGGPQIERTTERNGEAKGVGGSYLYLYCVTAPLLHRDE